MLLTIASAASAAAAHQAHGIGMSTTEQAAFGTIGFLSFASMILGSALAVAARRPGTSATGIAVFATGLAAFVAVVIWLLLLDARPERHVPSSMRSDAAATSPQAHGAVKSS